MAVLDILKKIKVLTWALSDQALVSGVNFLSAILIARALGLEHYGIFAICWSILQFSQTIQNAAIISPLMTIAPKSPVQIYDAYLTASFNLQIWFSITSCLFIYLLLSAASALSFFTIQSDLMVSLVFCIFSYQTQDYFRRVFYVQNDSFNAFINDILCYGGQILLLLIAPFFIKLTIVNILIVIASTSMAAVLAAVFSLRPKLINPINMRGTFIRNWTLAKWLLPSAVVQWLSGNTFLYVAAIMLGTQATGSIKACQNIYGVFHIVFQVIENIIPIRAARLFISEGETRLRGYLKKLNLIAAFSATIIGLVIVSLSNEILNIVYGIEFAKDSHLLVWLAFTYPFVFITVNQRIFLRTIEAAKGIFLSYLLMTTISLVSAPILAWFFKLDGIMLGLLLTNICMACSLQFSISSSTGSGSKSWR